MADPIKIECLADVIEHAMQACYKVQGLRRTIWWRGQCADRPDWILAPKIYRKGYDYETELMITTRFRLYAPSRYQNCPGEKANTDWLCLMQQHGLPSRLLDWTESALVATYFAVNQGEYLKELGVLWALLPGDLSKSQGMERRLCSGNSEEPPELPQLFERPFNRNARDPDKTIAFVPNQIDPRLLAQHATFSIHGRGTAMEQLKDHDKFLTKYTIPSSSKGRLLRELDICGINVSTLFPDLDHLANHYSEQRAAVPPGETPAQPEQDGAP